MAKTIYIQVDPAMHKEIAEDHLALIRREFDTAHWTSQITILQKAERFYPGNPVTLQMKQDYLNR